MTWGQHRDACTTRLAALVWLGMSLAFFLEIGGLAGWIFDHAGLGLGLGGLMFVLFWLWVWRCAPTDRDR